MVQSMILLRGLAVHVLAGMVAIQVYMTYEYLGVKLESAKHLRITDT